MFANSGKKAETVYSQRKVTWSLLPSEKVAAERPDEASACWLLRLALWENRQADNEVRLQAAGEG